MNVIWLQRVSLGKQFYDGVYDFLYAGIAMIPVEPSFKAINYNRKEATSPIAKNVEIIAYLRQPACVAALYFIYTIYECCQP